MHKYLHYKPDAHKASKIDLEVNIFLTMSRFLLIFRYIQYFQFSPIHETKILSFSQRKNTYLVWQYNKTQIQQAELMKIAT